MLRYIDMLPFLQPTFLTYRYKQKIYINVHTLHIHTSHRSCVCKSSQKKGGTNFLCSMYVHIQAELRCSSGLFFFFFFSSHLLNQLTSVDVKSTNRNGNNEWTSPTPIFEPNDPTYVPRHLNLTKQPNRTGQVPPSQTPHHGHAHPKKKIKLKLRKTKEKA